MNLTALPHLGSSVTIHSRNLFIVQTKSPTEMMVVQGKEAERVCCLIRQLGLAYIVKHRGKVSSHGVTTIPNKVMKVTRVTSHPKGRGNFPFLIR